MRPQYLKILLFAQLTVGIIGQERNLKIGVIQVSRLSIFRSVTCVYEYFSPSRFSEKMTETLKDLSLILFKNYQSRTILHTSWFQALTTDMAWRLLAELGMVSIWLLIYEWRILMSRPCWNVAKEWDWLYCSGFNSHSSENDSHGLHQTLHVFINNTFVKSKHNLLELPDFSSSNEIVISEDFNFDIWSKKCFAKQMLRLKANLDGDIRCWVRNVRIHLTGFQQ